MSHPVLVPVKRRLTTKTKKGKKHATHPSAASNRHSWMMFGGVVALLFFLVWWWHEPLMGMLGLRSTGSKQPGTVGINGTTAGKASPSATPGSNSKTSSSTTTTDRNGRTVTNQAAPAPPTPNSISGTPGTPPPPPPVAPDSTMSTFYANVSNGQTKQQVVGSASTDPNGCTQTNLTTLGSQEVCSWSSGNKSVIVTMLNDRVIGKTKTGF